MGAMTAIGLAALKSREGVRLTAYKDSVGVWTIGYGSTKGVTPGMKITQVEADKRLMDDLAAHDVMQFVTVPTSDNEADALRSIAFNIGLSGAKNSTFLKRLNAGDRAGCAAAIMFWKKPPEIISRRTAERDQFLTPYSKALPKGRSTDAKPIAAPAPEPIPEAPAEPTKADLVARLDKLTEDVVTLRLDVERLSA